MKILFYSPHSQLYFNAPTGYGSHMRGMVEAFKELGHEVDVLVLGEKPQANSEEHKTIKKKRWLKKSLPSFLWRTFKELNWMRFDNYAKLELDKKILSFQPDLVYERSAWMCCGSVEVIKKWGIQHVVEINAPFEEEIKSFESSHSLTHFIGRYKFKKLLQSCHGIASINSELTRVLCKKYDINKNKFIFTPNAISHHEIFLSQQSHVPSELEHLNEKLVFGFVGSILPYHGIDICIRAFSKMKKTDLHLLIVGDGNLIPSYKKLCDELGISKKVTFTGSIPKNEIWNYLTAMDVFLLPSTAWYCSPVKLFEYALMEKPIIAVNQPGVCDIFSEKSCILFSGSEEDLTLRFQEFIHNPSEFSSLAKSCKEIVLSQHQWTNNATKILNFLRL
jgi:glycosyltransferase involved in cell wall biosynthesis